MWYVTAPSNILIYVILHIRSIDSNELDGLGLRIQLLTSFTTSFFVINLRIQSK